MNKKNILFLIQTPPPVHGSSMVGKYIKDSPIINNSFQCKFINIGISRSINEIGKNPLVKLFRYVEMFWRIFFSILKLRPDLCYFALSLNGFALYKDAVLVLLLKTFKVNIVYHLHNKGASKTKSPIIKRILKYVLKDSYVILLSKYLYPDIQNFVKDNYIYYCPNGIPTIETNNNENILDPFKKFNSDTINLLYLSNMIISKGVFELLDACKKLQEDEIKINCHFVGNWKDITVEEFYNYLDKKKLHSNVFFHGPKYDNEKFNYLKYSDIFVFPTFYEYECFPLVLLEAMQFQLPIVSTFEGGIPDIVEDNKTGFLCKQKDTECLAEKIETLILNKDKREKMGFEAKKRFDNSFTLENFEMKLSSILSDILREK